MLRAPNTFLYISVLLLLFSCLDKKVNSKTNQYLTATKDDSISYWYLKAMEFNLAPKQKLIYLNRAFQLVKDTDSLYPFILKSKSANYSKIKDYNNAISEANKLRNFANHKKDTTLLSKAYFYLGYYYSKKTNFDDAFEYYNLAYDLSSKLNDSLTSAKLLGNISNIQNRLGDFVGAQKNAVKGIQLLNRDKHQKNLYNLYNSLANSFQNNLQFKEAENSYNEALKNGIKFIDTIRCQNNIALNYKKQKDYKKAILLYQEILQEHKLENYTTTKARVIDNLGHTLFLENNNEGLDLLLEGKDLRQQENDNYGLFASYIHLTEYYLEKEKTKALGFAQKAFSTSEKIKSPDAKVEALKHLITLKPFAKKEILEYLSLKDSIDLAEKMLKNRYVAVQFQTEKKEKENIQLKADNVEQELLTQKANTRNWLLVIGLLALGISAFFIYRRYKSEAKAKQIISEQKTLIEKLQKEFHHRLKNDFRSINSFISLVQRQFSNSEFKERLNELKNRVTSMFKVHEILLQEDDITQVKAHPYLLELSQNVEEKYKDQNIKLSCNIDKTETIIADKAIPFGIVLNEFVTNSYKYAFDKDGGEITIDFKSDKDNHHLTLKDNGKGLPKDFNIENLRSLGMSIIPMFAELHDGSYKLDGTNGVSLTLTLPKKIA